MTRRGSRDELLVQRVVPAFRDVTGPPPVRLVIGSSFEERRIEKALRKIATWMDCLDHPLELFDAEALCFLSPEAFHYFLPLVLLGVVRDYERADTMPGDFLTCLDSYRTSQTDFLKLLSRQQSLLLRDVLQFLLHEHSEDLKGNYHLAETLAWVTSEVDRNRSC